MKHILIPILFGLLLPGWAQKGFDDSNLPFQVIFAEGVENSQGQRVKELDIIPIDEVLTIGKDGFLSIMHYFGFPIEINGDTAIKIREIHNQLDQLRNGKTKYDNLKRPNIEYLFISGSEMGRKNMLSNTGACYKCIFDLELIYPPKHNTITVYYKGDFCFKWRQYMGSENYEVEIGDMFGEKLKTYTATTNELRIEENEMKALINTEQELLLRIIDLKTNKISDWSVLREFPSSLIEFPYSCSPQKATYALIAGFYLELSPAGYPKDAEKYFKLATELSGREFFKTMLNNFYERRQY